MIFGPFGQDAFIMLHAIDFELRRSEVLTLSARYASVMDAIANTKDADPDLAIDLDEILQFFAHRRKRLLTEKFRQQVEKLLGSDLNPRSDGDIAAIRTSWEHATLKLIQVVMKKVLLVQGRSTKGPVSKEITDGRKVEGFGQALTRHRVMKKVLLLEGRSNKGAVSMKSTDGGKVEDSGQALTNHGGNKDETKSQKVPALVTFHKSPKTFRKFAMPAEETLTNLTRYCVKERIRHNLKLQAARRELLRQNWVSRRQRIRNWLVAPREFKPEIKRTGVKAARVSESTALVVPIRRCRQRPRMPKSTLLRARRKRARREVRARRVLSTEPDFMLSMKIRNKIRKDKSLHGARMQLRREAALAASDPEWAARKEARTRRIWLKQDSAASANALWAQLMHWDVVERKGGNGNTRDELTTPEQAERLEQAVLDYTARLGD
ncbi:hypothetical protein EJ03DRAFT_347107 [Teratosphaeria nubilosa]|uniref:Uncharacterized protein n=1 Tax=Teratosphaeria nubilosa TaxID=161662 RepID=A0A6G1LPT5_9PEZI|nr:hypothetical protein EJ03DRAFT_347107 [Teratosphaeria nubilosa]